MWDGFDVPRFRGRLGRKLMWRFAAFVIVSNLIVLIVVGGQSAFTLNREIERSSSLQAYLSMQSLEHRLQFGMDSSRQLSENPRDKQLRGSRGGTHLSSGACA